MIKIEQGEKYDSCNCCHEKKDVKQIKFMSKYSGMTVVLCEDCREELMKKLKEESEIVHCKDCVNYHPENGRCEADITDILGYGRQWNEDDFCSQGMEKDHR